MNQEKQPDAIELAARLETIAASGVNIFSSRLWMRKAATELQRLHALAEKNRAELVAEAARTAEEKLRADQMTEQHRMQCNMRKEIEEENQQLRGQYDAAASVVAELQAQLSAIGAGGVEALRKRHQDVGSSITIDFKQATELLEMFGGEPAEITLMEGDGHSGNGLYAIYTDMPEEGSGFLGASDNEAMPEAPAQEHATQLAGQGQEDEIEIIRQLVEHIERNTCEHHETYRGGAIWEICSGCGAKWADDEGGKPEFQWAESVERARAFLISTNKANKDEQA